MRLEILNISQNISSVSVKSDHFHFDPDRTLEVRSVATNSASEVFLNNAIHDDL